MQELKVKNVIIGKQFEDSENLQEFLKIVKDKKIKVIVVEGGSRVNIEDNLYFDVLWPSSSNSISENAINNNALVCKLNYKNFSMLFTGDIEEEAEKVLVSKYKNTNVLKSTVLKVGHHGSKTSSTQEFLELIKPKIALIGVGANNLYGHPNEEVIDRLESLSCKIYRTDKNGEISLLVNNKGKVKLKKIID
jgi:competence protein ComEC